MSTADLLREIHADLQQIKQGMGIGMPKKRNRIAARKQEVKALILQKEFKRKLK